MPLDHIISQRARGVDASGIRKAFDLAAKLKDPINLSIGMPDFDVPDVAKEAAIAAIRAGHNRYTQTQGIAPLRERLRADLSREMQRDVGEVLITSGGTGALFLTLLATIDPGDEAIFLDPYFVMYRHLMTLVNGKPIAIDSYPDFRFPAERVEQAITPRTKLLILNSPANPTGVVLSEAEVQAAIDIARRHDLLIISDEIYEPFLYTGARDGPGAEASHKTLPSPAMRYENTMILRGFSKSHSMTGWRLGYTAGPAEVIAQMTKLQQYTFVCAPSALQHAALAALDVPMGEAQIAYHRKRDVALEILSKKFEIVRPDGAFYLFPKAPGGISASAFAALAVERNVIVIPGNVFSDRDTHFRISYATTDQKLREGCRILCDLV